MLKILDPKRQLQAYTRLATYQIHINKVSSHILENLCEQLCSGRCLICW